MVFNDLVEDELDSLQTMIEEKRNPETTVEEEMANIEYHLNEIRYNCHDMNEYRVNVGIIAESLFAMAEKAGFSLYKEVKDRQV